MGYNLFARHFGIQTDSQLLLNLCLTSTVWMASENVSQSKAILIWIMIRISNSLLYAVPGGIVALLTRHR